jgi:hypothetical protein
MKWISFLIIGLFFLVFSSFNFSDPWKEANLMAPETLANMIGNAPERPIRIINIGPAGLIKLANDIGPMSDVANVEKLKNLLRTTEKSIPVVIYCGCCPFKNCPNIRPAFELLKFYKFQKPYLLNLSHNLKVDWIDKGYPMHQ